MVQASTLRGLSSVRRLMRSRVAARTASKTSSKIARSTKTASRGEFLGAGELEQFPVWQRLVEPQNYHKLWNYACLHQGMRTDNDSPAKSGNKGPVLPWRLARSSAAAQGLQNRSKGPISAGSISVSPGQRTSTLIKSRGDVSAGPGGPW